MTNAFREHLIRNGEAPIAFARRSGIARNAVYNLYHGTFARHPLPDTLMRVEALTGIPFETLYAEFIEPYERAYRDRARERNLRGPRQGDERL